jgi:hypothetical protein
MVKGTEKMGKKRRNREKIRDEIRERRRKKP